MSDQRAELLVATLNGDGTVTLASSTNLTLRAGVNTVTADVIAQSGHSVPLVQAGQLIGIHGAYGVYYQTSAGAPGWYECSTLPSVSTSKSTIGVGSALQLRVSVAGTLVSQSDNNTTRLTSVETYLGSTAVFGVTPPDPAAGTSASGGNTYFSGALVPFDGYLKKLRIATSSVGAGQLIIATLNADGTVTIASSTAITLASGLNTLNVNVAVSAGQLVGVYTANSIIKFVASGSMYRTVGVPTTSTAKATLTGTLQWEFTFRRGMVNDVENLQINTTPAGLNLLDTADATGVSDATSLLATARASHDYPYVRPGTFAVTSVPYYGRGLWGPGKVVLSGNRFFIPQRPYLTSLYLRLRQSLYSLASSGSPLIIIGDSISRGQGASTPSTHSIFMLTRFLNQFNAPTDYPLMTEFSTTSRTFEGMTTSGTATLGSTGPVGENLILADGAALSFTATLSQLGVFYNQKAGAGNLLLGYNGSTYATITCAGTTDLDHYSGSNPTGQTSSGTYTITASGGPVEITGIERLGTVTASTPARIRVHKAAHNGWTFNNFQTAAIQNAILKQAAAFGSTPIVVIALGTNDMASTLPSTIKSRANTLITALKTGGVASIYAILPFRNPTLSYSANCSYEGTCGQLTDAYVTAGVTIIPLDAIDWDGESFVSDHTHPNDAGYDVYAQGLIGGLCGAI